MKRTKIYKIAATILLILIVTIIGKYYHDKSFAGNEKIQLIEDSDKIETKVLR